jgi:4-coumarate--CoA ligase
MSLDPRLCTPSLTAKNSRWICVIPLYHGLAQCYFFNIAAYRRVTTYIMKTYEINKMLEQIQRFKITELHLVPPIVVALTKHAGIKNGTYDLSSTTKTFSCAAPLGAEICVQYENLWPKGVMNVKQGYAMSESTCNTLGWDPTLTSPAGSVGEPMPNCEIRLMDDEVREVPQGERGEIWVRCPNVMKGYLRNVEATRNTITEEGWLKMGDIAYVDEEGRYYIVDRKKVGMVSVKVVQLLTRAGID